METNDGMNEKPWWILVGGRRRLGRALAEALAPDHNLVLTSSTSWESETRWITGLSKETQVRCLRWDAASADLNTTIMADMSALGVAGITPNCAVLVSGSFPRSPLGAWDVEGLEATWRLNLTFPLLVSQAVGPLLAEGGCLQLILDTAIHKPFIQHLPYAVAKSGLAALVPGLARLLAPRARVVGHALGTLLPDAGTDPSWLASRSLTQRLGEPGDLARALRFAAQSPYLTGEIITLDGGTRWV